MIHEINLINDKEVQQLRKQWKEIFPTEEFPCLSYSYGFVSIDDYKQKIKKAIETRDKTEIVRVNSTDFFAEYFSN